MNNNGHVNKKLWIFIKSQRKDHCSVVPLKYNSKMHDDTTMKTDILNNYFTSVFTQDSVAPPPPIQGPPFPDMSPIAINCDGVAQLLTTLYVHKATGPDHIPSRLLKEISSEIAPSLTLIFQASLYHGIRGDLLAWLKNFLSNRIQCVVVDGKQVNLQLLHLGYCACTLTFLKFYKRLIR